MSRVFINRSQLVGLRRSFVVHIRRFAVRDEGGREEMSKGAISRQTTNDEASPFGLFGPGQQSEDPFAERPDQQGASADASHPVGRLRHSPEFEVIERDRSWGGCVEYEFEVTDTSRRSRHGLFIVNLRSANPEIIFVI